MNSFVLILLKNYFFSLGFPYCLGACDEDRFVQCREDMTTALGFKPHDQDRYWTFKLGLKKRKC